jgi:hypothetical protein
MTAIDTTRRGEKFGSLTIEYTTGNGHRVAVRCVCQKLFFVSAEALNIATTCGECRTQARYFGKSGWRDGL